MIAKKTSARKKNGATDAEAFRRLFENYPIPMLVYDIETLAFLHVNEAAAALYGYSCAELEQMNVRDVLPPEEIVRLAEILRQEYPRLRRSSEWRNRCRDGSIIIVEVASHTLDFKGRQAVLTMAQDITARKQAEALLLKLKKAVDTSNDAIFLTDTDGIFTYANPSFTALYGFTAEEVVGKVTPRILKSGLVAQQVYVEFWKTLKAGQEIRGEFINKKKNGKLIDIEGSATPILDDAGSIIGYLGIQRDITERKQAEEELRWAVERYHTLFDEAPMMDIVTRVRDGVPIITECNRAFLTALGYTRTEVLGRPLADFYAPESHLTVLEQEKYVRAPDEEFTAESPALVARDGRIIHTILAATPETNAQGKVVGTRGMYIDITERQKAVEAWRIAETNYRALFENATVGIYQSTPEGRFLNINPVMARIFGYESPQEMLDLIVDIERQYYVDPADRLTFQRLMQEQGQVYEYRCWSYRKDGSQILIQENARAVKDEQGNILHYEGFITDITAHWAAEDALRRAKESLEQANRELEDVLAREQHLARTDGLTGLYNYRHFFELATHEFNIAMRYQHSLCILMFDADNFKQINDTYGHLAGDIVLAQVAETVTAQMRATDVLARYGGDEFVVLLLHTNTQQAFSIAERIRAAVGALQVRLDEQVTLAVTLSMGVAGLLHTHPDSNIESVIQHADKALYEAKQAGRNRTVIFEQEQA